MRYELEQGPTEKLIVEQALRQKKPIPDVIANKPRLLPGLEFYFLAFNALSSCRETGFGVGRIPWTAAREYADYYGLSKADFSRLWDLICRMDSVYINHSAEKAEAESRQAEERAKTQSRR